MFYSSWFRFLDQTISIYPFQLRSRSDAKGEEPYSSIEEAARDCADMIQEFSDKPIIFFGHSMGGVIAYLTAFYLKSIYKIDIEKLIVSASIPEMSAICRDKNKCMSDMSDEEFCKTLVENGGIDEKILAIKEFYDDFLPVLRADFSITEKYVSDPENKISCDISVYAAKDDKIVPVDMIDMWQKYTYGSVSSTIFEGGHFFIKKHIQDICRELNDTAGSI